MKTLAEVCGSAVAFTYLSIDRLILNAYIPTLQTLGAMARSLARKRQRDRPTDPAPCSRDQSRFAFEPHDRLPDWTRARLIVGVGRGKSSRPAGLFWDGTRG